MTRLAIPRVTISQVLRQACLRLRSLESRFSRFHSIHDTAIETAFFSELKVDDRTLERIPQQPALLLKQKGLLRIDNVRCRAAGRGHIRWDDSNIDWQAFPTKDEAAYELQSLVRHSFTTTNS